MSLIASPPRPLLSAFSHAYPGHTPDVLIRAPGGINLLGGHVDMHGGFVLNMAINREIWIAAGYGTAEHLVRLYAADLDSSVTFSLRRLDSQIDAIGAALPSWAHYPAGIAWALQRRGLRVNGIQAAFMGNLQMQAGLSSSAAVEIGFVIAWQALERWWMESKDMAEVGHDAERQYMKAGTGIHDQFTCLHARERHALWLDCRTLEFGHILLPSSATVVICDTGTRRDPFSSHEKQRAEDCLATARAISLVDRSVKSLRDVTPDRLDYYESMLSEEQYQRSRHIVTEMVRVQQGIKALMRGDAIAFGEHMKESYWSARDLYGSSSPALDTMWRVAEQHPGCYGARYSGSGEGGSIIALVDTNAVDDFIRHIEATYEHATGIAPEVFAVTPAECAGVFI